MKIKRFIIMLTCMALVLSFIGCAKLKDEGGTEESENNNDYAVEETENNEGAEETKEAADDEATKRNAGKMVAAFIEALMAEDIEEAMKHMIFGKDTTFIDEDGVKWALLRTELRDIVGMNGKIIDIEETGLPTSKDVRVTVAFDDGHERNLYFFPSLNDDNEYKVNFPEMYVENWEVCIPGNSVLYIDGKEVSKNYIERKDGLYDVYSIPALIRREAEIKIVSDGFGEYTTTVMPKEASEEEFIKFWIDGEEAQAILDEFKDIFNKLITSYAEGKSVSDVRSFFSDSMDEAMVEMIYNDNIGKGFYSSGENSNIVITDIIPNYDEDAGIFPRSDKVVVVNFGFTATWNHRLLGERMMKRYSKIALERTDDGYKIYELLDDSLFRYLNFLSKEF